MAIPIPHRPSGFLLGDPAALVTLDAFIDIQCPHSRAAWPTLMAVMKYYQDDPVSLKVHMITLSNHRQAWDISLGLFALAEGDASRFYDFATFVYERQDQFYNAPFLHKTHEDLRQFVADLAQAHSNIDREAFLKRMGDNDIYVNARTPIRYAATKSVWATPTFFVNNGNNVPVDHKSSLDDWIKLIDSLLAS
ncbi:MULTISPECIES: DsbA family protein [Vibrio]|uniref:DsbA family protein n=1 Tax=Vibrio TaxID=662 RepID=UPI001BD39E60|nr:MULTISPECIES: thioredoxin domain-containing protein [Vibrio]MBS9878480.1 thioredoxin domain-containing protein [Vibrio alginolyticus]MDW1939367.1 thioredoxin domain-containing protein [Vibrio sp. 818]MDW1985462.1 thioredoxin domain-containing protein [Vibrio sp. 811]MDW1996815.1 thioredoxin domain-containing protein [Vibrio sp. 299]MDW2001891.1 thioredoxin domain-containing protein [Vibrio sp. 2304]